MSCLQNEILLENLYEEGLEQAAEIGLLGKVAEDYAEAYAKKKFENMA